MSPRAVFADRHSVGALSYPVRCLSAWLCRDAVERADYLDMQRRLRRPTRISAAIILAGVVPIVPFLHGRAVALVPTVGAFLLFALWVSRKRLTGNSRELANEAAWSRPWKWSCVRREVFVRELSPEEGARLKRLSKRAKYQSKRQRAVILLASSTGMPAPQIAAVVRSDESQVRKVIHAFNERGFSSLDPDYRGGRPKKTTPVQRDGIVAVARARPDTQGVALTRWSLSKLQEHLAGMGIVLSEEALRQTLIGAGLSHRRTRSWKWSPDPDFQAKAERVLGLYRHCPDNGVVVCFDEMGPIQLNPHQGSGWAERKRPERLRATYKKNGGVRYLFGAYDVHSDRLHGRLRPHKSGQEVLASYRQIRIRYPAKIPDLSDRRQPLRAQDPRDPPLGR